MRTKQSELFRGMLGGGLFPDDLPVDVPEWMVLNDREAALLAWEKRHRAAAEKFLDEAKQHQAAGRAEEAVKAANKANAAQKKLGAVQAQIAAIRAPSSGPAPMGEATRRAVLADAAAKAPEPKKEPLSAIMGRLFDAGMGAPPEEAHTEETAPAPAPAPAPVVAVPPATGVPVVKKNPMKSVVDSTGAVRAAHADNSKVKEFKVRGGPGNMGMVYAVQMEGGPKAKAIFKPTSETGLLEKPEIRDGLAKGEDGKVISEAARERAAYRISEAAGFNVVPHVERINFGSDDALRARQAVILDKLNSLVAKYSGFATKLRKRLGKLNDALRPGGPGEDTASYLSKVRMGEGHTMALVNGKSGLKLPLDKQIYNNGDHPDVHRIAALDMITGNTDRHEANYIRGNDARYYAIDNGLAFSHDHKGHTEVRQFMLNGSHGGDGVLQGKPIHPEVKKEIDALKPEHVDQIMQAEGFQGSARAAAVARLKALQELTHWPTGKRSRTLLDGTIVPAKPAQAVILNRAEDILGKPKTEKWDWYE